MLSLDFSCIPKCPVCYAISNENLTVCCNGHFICSLCYDKMDITLGCPMCREVLIPTPIKNQWANDFIQNIKNKFLESSPFKIGEFVDYFTNSNWESGTITDICLEKNSFKIEADTFQEEPVYVLLNEINENIKPVYTMTINWRNFDFLSNYKNIYICLCEEMYKTSLSCDYTFCPHNKIWINSKIVYICANSKYILCVFIHEHNNNANSIWSAMDSKRIGLFKK